MTTKSTLSPFKIYWAEFTPVDGKIATLKDIYAINGSAHKYIGRFHANCLRWFGSKARALDFIQTFNKKLSKKYMVRLFTDKQFGMTKIAEGEEIPYTKKQLVKVYFIG